VRKNGDGWSRSSGGDWEGGDDDRDRLIVASSGTIVSIRLRDIRPKSNSEPRSSKTLGRCSLGVHGPRFGRSSKAPPIGPKTNSTPGFKNGFDTTVRADRWLPAIWSCSPRSFIATHPEGLRNFRGDIDDLSTGKCDRSKRERRKVGRGINSTDPLPRPIHPKPT
jgi:hypothetical protein